MGCRPSVVSSSGNSHQRLPTTVVLDPSQSTSERVTVSKSPVSTARHLSREIRDCIPEAGGYNRQSSSDTYGRSLHAGINGDRVKISNADCAAAMTNVWGQKVNEGVLDMTLDGEVNIAEISPVSTLTIG